MSFQTLFPTTIFYGQLAPKGTAARNRDLLSDCHKLAEIDREGQLWSRKNYIGGYTSYSSVSNLHETFSTFMDLQKLIDRQVKKFTQKLEVDLQGRRLQMSTCWVNIMPSGTHHSLHLHPLSFISGTYYVSVPKDSSSLKLEDPRMGLFMASPPRKANASMAQRNFVSLPPKEGHVVLFESWLRHEVPAQQGKRERVSISFNYDWI